MTNIVLFIFGVINLIAFAVLVAGLVNPNLSLFNKLTFLRTKANLSKRLYLLVIYFIFSIIICCLCVPFIDDTKTLPNQPDSVKNVSDEEIKKDSILLDRCKTLFNELMSFKDEKEFAEKGFGTGGKYHKWLNEEIKDFSDEEKRRLLTVYGIVPGDIEQLALDYAIPPKTADGMKSMSELEKRLKRVFDLQVRNDVDFSDEAEQAYSHDDKTTTGKWHLSSKESGFPSYILEVFSFNENYYYAELNDNDEEASYGKLIKRGNNYYKVPLNLSGEYFLIVGKKLSLGDDSGIYEDGTKEYYAITCLE